MKRILKKAIFIMIILILLFSINTEVFALGQVIQDGDSFLGAADGSGGAGSIDQTSLQNLSGYLYNILLSGGVIIAVIIATVLGIQFMLGGAEGQAKVKEMLIPFVVGCVVVFGGFGIWKIAIEMGKSLENIDTSKAENVATAFIEENDIDAIFEEYERAKTNSKNNPSDKYLEKYMLELENYVNQEKAKMDAKAKEYVDKFVWETKSDLQNIYLEVVKEMNKATPSKKYYWRRCGYYIMEKISGI